MKSVISVLLVAILSLYGCSEPNYIIDITDVPLVSVNAVKWVSPTECSIRGYLDDNDHKEYYPDDTFVIILSHSNPAIKYTSYDILNPGDFKILYKPWTTDPHEVKLQGRMTKGSGGLFLGKTIYVNIPMRPLSTPE